MRRTAMALLLVLVTAAHAFASTEPPAPGERIRATFRSPKPARQESLLVVHGLWLGLSEERSLMLQAEARPETLRLPVADVTRLEVSRGARRHAKQGAVIGAVVGGTAGAAVGFAVSIGEDVPAIVITGGSPDEGKAGRSMLRYGAAGCVAGAVVGALVGHAIKGGRWEPVVLESLQGSLEPLAPGMNLRMGLRVGF